jgi:release factor glutamine methyltransferase
MTTIQQALSDARRRLQSSSPSPAVDAGSLLCHVLHCDAGHLIAWPEKELTPHQQAHFGDCLQQRIGGRPVAYITGEREFWSLSLKVSEDVLIPRPETETLVEFVLRQFADRAELAVADLGTGSGAIACAIAAEKPLWTVVATDVSTRALEIAQHNAGMHRLDNIEFLQGQWYEPLHGRHFDLVVSNPPYVAEDDPHLSAGDVRFEPSTALSSGRLGMDAIKHLTRRAHTCLKYGGWLILEHGYDQQPAVHACFSECGFDKIIHMSDLAGMPRVNAGRNLYSGA